MELIDQIVEQYGFIFQDELIEEISKNSRLKKVKEGDVLVDIGEQIKVMPLLLSGVIKVMREDKEGDDLLLYFLEHGDTCTMTLTCCMGDAKSEIRTIAETDAEILLIPVEKMEEWLLSFKSWRNFVFESYNSRMSEMLETIDSLAFMKMDERLYKYLVDAVKLHGSTTITKTHQDIAYELHTSRVVVSRLLKTLEKNKKIEIYRNRIEVLDF
jgi:CRP/FNR family transcriptional regulator, anaerobic regulatory protein